MDKITIPLREVAREAGISADQAKYWVRLLGISPKVHGRVGYLESDEAANIQKMAHLVKEGANPKNAAEKIKGPATAVALVPQPQKNDDLDEIRKALMLLVESNRAVTEENRLMREEIRSLRQESLVFQKLLTPPPIPVKPKLPAPIRAAVVESSQRNVSSWESLKTSLDDFRGFVFGNG